MLVAPLHGVTLAWTREDSVPDLVASLGLDAGLGARVGRGRLEIALRRGDEATRKDPASDGAEPSFFHGIIQGYASPRGAPKGFVLWDRRTRVLVPEGGARIDVFHGGEEIVPGSARAALEIALALALREHGLFHLHAAALVDPAGRTLLLVGGSGAGKTTATIALATSGYAFLGDDALLLEDGPKGPTLDAFPRPFHIGPATLTAFPHLAPMTLPAPGLGDKRHLDPELAFPGRRRDTCPAPALVLHPRVDPEGTTTLAPMGKADALGNLVAASGGLAIDGAARKEEHLDLLARVTNGARHAELCMGRDLLRDPSLLARLVS